MARAGAPAGFDILTAASRKSDGGADEGSSLDGFGSETNIWTNTRQSQTQQSDRRPQTDSAVVTDFPPLC